MGTDIVNFDEAYAKEAARYAQQETLGGGQFLSTRGGVLSYADQELPGNQLVAVVLDSVRERTYYGAKFDPDMPASPVCYAFGRGSEEIGPHPTMQAHPDYFIPQHDSCTGCPMDQWGSADTGKGKACQDRRRLALIPAGMYLPKRGSRDFDLDLFTDPKHFQSAEVAFLKLPVMSVKNWAAYVQQIVSQFKRPPYGVITRVYVEPDPKSQYRVKFELIEALPDDLAQIIMARHDEAASSIITAYIPPQEREEPQRGGLKGLRR
jgi:hypothetical protein